jgi:phosphate ABC transporter permease protein PstC
MLIAIPLALAAALYTAEFAPPRLREWIKPAIELLAGIPSVVLGFFAQMVLATWVQAGFHVAYRLNAITAGIALAFAIIPIIYTVSEDAMTAVPRLYREASLALGASKGQTAVRVVLPAAIPGIAAAIVLGFGRGIGETMIVLMVSGNSATLSLNPALPVRTLSATIAAEMAEAVVGSGHYRILFFLGVLLFLITAVVNSIGDRFNRKLRERLLARHEQTQRPFLYRIDSFGDADHSRNAWHHHRKHRLPRDSAPLLGIHHGFSFARYDGRRDFPGDLRNGICSSVDVSSGCAFRCSRRDLFCRVRAGGVETVSLDENGREQSGGRSFDCFWVIWSRIFYPVHWKRYRPNGLSRPVTLWAAIHAMGSHDDGRIDAARRHHHG